jgi:hypothetical protein
MKEVRTINAHCHGCGNHMPLEAKPATFTNMLGVVETHWGKDTAAWICSICRLDPKKLKAARVAAGLPATPELSKYDDDDGHELAEVA